MALYAATCARERGRSGVISVAVHSSGLKVKGDGVRWPSYTASPNSQSKDTGECDGCEYYPMVPKASAQLAGLKLCVFDGVQDIIDYTNYTHSSQTLAAMWPSTGGAVEEFWHRRGHCFIVRWSQILNCLAPGLVAQSEDDRQALQRMAAPIP
jgi:hypothetical protein